MHADYAEEWAPPPEQGGFCAQGSPEVGEAQSASLGEGLEIAAADQADVNGAGEDVGSNGCLRRRWRGVSWWRLAAGAPRCADPRISRFGRAGDGDAGAPRRLRIQLAAGVSRATRSSKAAQARVPAMHKTCTAHRMVENSRHNHIIISHRAVSTRSDAVSSSCRAWPLADTRKSGEIRHPAVVMTYEHPRLHRCHARCPDTLVSKIGFNILRKDPLYVVSSVAEGTHHTA